MLGWEASVTMGSDGESAKPLGLRIDRVRSPRVIGHDRWAQFSMPDTRDPRRRIQVRGAMAVGARRSAAWHVRGAGIRRQLTWNGRRVGREEGSDLGARRSVALEVQCATS